MRTLALMAATALSLIAGGAHALEFAPKGQIVLGSYNKSGTEISAYDPVTKRLFASSAEKNAVNVIDMSNIGALKLITSLPMGDLGGGVNSVAVKNGVLAIAVEAKSKQANGKIVLFSASDLKQIAAYEVGALPDMVTFSPDGRYIVCADEGEPSGDYKNDPEGTVGIIDLTAGLDKGVVRLAGFGAYSWDKLTGVKKGKKGQTFAQDAEPEYVTFSLDGKTAYVSLQEVNALAEVDVASATVTRVTGLGFKDWSKDATFDPSERDGDIMLANWPVWGMYQPDGITTLPLANGDYVILSANEGDSRDYPGHSEESRIGDIQLDKSAFPKWEMLLNEGNLGRLKISTDMGDTDGDGDLDQLYAYGARSMSVWSKDGKLLVDTGDMFEKFLAAKGKYISFNPSHDLVGGDMRSDDKGPEPESVVVGVVNGVTYAFVGLERESSVLALDMTDPMAPKIVGAASTRVFNIAPATGKAGDTGPEGILFIPAAQSPSGKDLLVVSYEVTSSIRVYEITP